MSSGGFNGSALNAIAFNGSGSGSVVPDHENMLTAEALAEDQVAVLSYALTLSEATAEDFAQESAERLALLTDDAVVSDSPMIGVITPVLDAAASATDATWTGSVATVVTDTAIVSDWLEQSATGGVSLADAAVATDAVWSSAVALAESVATATDTALDGSKVIAVSTANATDEVITSTAQYALAESAATATDELWSLVESLQIVAVVADAIDQVIMPDQYAMAMVMNVETGAPYLYDNFPIMAAAQADEAIYAIGPDGLYQLSGNDDDGFAIEAHVELPGLMLGKPDNRGNLSRSPERKRVGSVWLDCEAEQPMTLDVESYDQDRLTQRYEAIHALDDTGNMKVDVGKGLKSKWWGMTIRNTNGGDFTLLGAFADVLSTARRR